MIPGREQLPDCKIIESPHIEMERQRMGGQPVLRGTRMPVAQILGEILQAAVDKGIVKEFCDNFGDGDDDPVGKPDVIERLLYEVTDFYGRCRPDGLRPKIGLESGGWKYTAVTTATRK